MKLDKNKNLSHRCVVLRLKAGVAVPALVASLLLAACGGIDPEASYALAEARIEEHNYREAAIHARNVLQADDTHAEARLLLGRAALALADFQDAEFHLTRAAAAGITPRDYAIPLAEVRIQQDNLSAALEVLDSVPDDERDDEYWIARSAVLLRSGDIEAAKDALDQSDSNSAAALLARAQLAGAQQDLLAAEVLARQAVEADASDPEAWAMVASVATAAERSAEAEAALERVGELYMARGQFAYAAPAMLQLVQLRLGQGRFNDAAESAGQLAARLPGSIHASLAAGLVALRKGDAEEALDALRQAAALAPNHPEVEMVLGAAHLAAGNLGQAEQRLQTALAGGSQNPAVARLLAEARLRQGRPGPALEAISRLDTQFVEQDPALALLAGIAHLESGSPANAIRFLELAVELAPANSAAALQLARAYGAVGRQSDAARLMQSLPAVGVQGGYAAKVAMLLQTLRDQGEAAARAFVDELLDENPSDPENLVVAATLAYTLNDRSSSRTYLDTALASNSDFVPAMLLTASLNIEEGMMGEAEALLNRALELSPGDSAASLALARLRAEHGDERGAREVLRDAAAVSSDVSPRVMVALGDLERRLGAPDEAQRIAETLQRQVPPRPEGYLLEASIHQEAERYSEAAAAYRAAYELRPSWDALRGAVAAFQAAGEGGWEPLLMARLHAEPDDVSARLLLAGALQTSDRTTEALAAYEAVLTRDANNVVALNNAAWLGYGGDNEKALSYAERAVELVPENAAVLDTLGWILVREERLDEALPHLEKAAQLSSGSPEIRYHLAVAQATLGRTDDARNNLEALLSEPNDFPSRDEAQALLDTL